MDHAHDYGSHSRIGHVLHGARGYDVMTWVFLLGREGAFRERVLDLAQLAPDEVVLDVGCGTGTLAIRAKRRVGDSGRVHGIDPSPEMIARAQKKARRAGVEVTFATEAVQRLPFADATFDVVLSTVMMHHLSRPDREEGARQIRRVLKPGGRVVVVDFGKPARRRRGVLGHLQVHGGVDSDQIAQLLADAGLEVVEARDLGLRNLHATIARVRA